MQYHLKIVTLRASFMCEKSGTLPPYLGSTIRGIMGHCFRKFACVQPNTKCFLCEQRENCIYVKYFSNTGKVGGAINSYAIWVLRNGKTQWQEGDECVFELTLFGNAAEESGIYLDAIMAMEHMGWGAMRLPFKLIRITNVQTGKLISASKRTWIRNLSSSYLETIDNNAKTAFISFDTPLRIVSGGKLCRVPTFEMLMQFLMRRFSLISQVHSDELIEWDQENILKQARQVNLVDYKLREVNFERYSMNHKENKLELPAIEGWMLYEGEMTSLIPILEAGKYLRIGKGATIGFGHYETFYDR